MRKFLISAAVAAAALTAAVPAAAQWAPPPPYGHAYGYDNYGQVRRLEARVWQLRREIDRLDARNVISEREADRLKGIANDIRRDLQRASYRGLNRYERELFERRIRHLEFRIQREARDGNRWDNRRYGERDWHDRDRDGRNDRWEDDRGRDHD